MRLQQRLPSQLAKRPTTTSPRSPTHRTRQHRTQSSNSPTPTNTKANAHNQPKHAPPPSGTAASSAGAPTPPVSPAPRSLGQRIQAGPVGRLGRSYTRIQERRPYATQVVSSIVIYLCGDLSAQFLFPSESSSPAREAKDGDGEREGVEGQEGQSILGGYDPWRTMRHLAVGVGSSIPTFKWFMFLHRNFNYSSKFLSILTKVTVQQIVFTPVFNTYFFSLQSLLSGATLGETFERLKKALPLSIQNSVKLWPAVTAFSFMYVAPQFRSIFSGCIAVGWQTYLSWLNQKAAKEVAAAEYAEMMSSKALTSSGIDSSATLKT
ncbi:hypothetical protein ASPWEDRAFT_40244 [Aspergillus wentii DTO 134E9]|uniref:Integral membrane protein, Mpv17/PMP22 family n=1 Tax=Aspergillus wentii DTO 134E9 TaxID=1073089 RepID=A0A1L9RJI5_ASPWE|nr:uncharacterized protein ASPWEDRAFT_40244 [Aspergillus wentii DTO 134E9]KAI9931944.1 hypothetical protein MW887_009445 [Aspergillus wentii]OJJ35100.1 hypothetical protein ASPWEDRAFT_40244 [Aspergillus wentii DTO 134E9]